jgi:hypothetical protein
MGDIQRSSELLVVVSSGFVRGWKTSRYAID